MAKEQVFLANGEPLAGIALERDDFEAHPGYMHGAVHVWVWRTVENSKQVLIQRRALTKKTLPGMLDISAAGHIDADETELEAAVREAYEEIGLDIDIETLHFIFRLRKTNVHNGISTVYLREVDETFVPNFNDGEVDSCSWLGLSELEMIFADPEKYNFANHGRGYFELLLEHLKLA